MTEIALTRGFVAVVDSDDADLAALNWNPQKGRYTTYAYRTDCSSVTTRRVAMHRLIMSRLMERELKRNELVDHIDGDGLNNRRGNLRLASRTQNARNGRTRAKNKTGFKGVWQINNGFAAKICVNHQAIYLGFYKTPEEAHAAYREAALKYHGEFANFGDSPESKSA